MSSQSSEDISVSEKKVKPRRAEREIYRPGALRQLKEVSQSHNEPLKVEKACNDKTKKIAEAKPQSQDATSRKDVYKEIDRSNLNPKPKSDNLNYKTDNNKPKMSKENLIHHQSKENINRKPENNVSSSDTIMKTKVNDDRVSNNNFKSKNKSSYREDSYYYGKESTFRQPYKEEYHKLTNKDFNRSFSEESGHKNMKSKGKSYRLNSKEENYFPGKMDKKKENRYPHNSNVSENFKPVKINKENHKEIKMTGSRDNKTIAKTIIKEENPSKMIIKRETCPNSTAISEDFHQTVMVNKEDDKVEIFPNKLEFKRSKKNDIERYKPKQFSDKKISKVPNSRSSPKFIENKYSYENDEEKSKMESKFSSCNTEDVSKVKENSNEHINTKNPPNSRIKETLAKNTYFPDSDSNQRDKKEKLAVLKCNDIKNKESNVKNDKSDRINDKSNKYVHKNDIKLPEKVNHISYKDNSQDCIVDKSKKNIAYSLSPLESSKYAVTAVGGPSSEEAGSDIEETTNEGNRKTVNPMLYIEYKESSFYGNSQKNKISDKGLQRTPQHSSVAWSDEKWAPSQRQKKKKQKNISKDFGHIESPGRRGIIQINNTPSNFEPHAETVVPGQRLLFNPNNPSKPLAVIPSARDLPPSWDHSYGGQEKHEETQPGISSNESVHDNEGSGNVDPSIFYSIQKGELDICYFVNSNQLPQEFKRIMDIRLHLQGCYKQLLISDIRLCQEKNVEGALWKTLYYVIIEKLREYISREPTLKDRSLSTLMMIVEEGLNYFQSLLSDIQKAYRFSLDTHFEEDLTTLPGTKNRVRHALYSCQKIILSMGDLSRYREQYNPNPNYIHAKKWYEMALQVNPKNGRPFNQLAIIAVSQKRSLDVVYYYIRSLTASNPFTSARDSLISMFDDIRRKYESMNKSKQCSESSKRYDDSKYEEHDDRRSNGSLRQEIWIRPDSGATNKRTLSQSDPEEDKRARIEELLKVPHDQLMKQFLTSYLHCHGMLFSRVGLDHFNKVLGETLSVFQALLQANPPKLSSTHMLQILAINMFAVDNTQLRDCRIESSYRSAAQDLALLLSQEMFSRLAEVMVKLFPSCLNYTVKDGGGGASGTSVPKDEGEFPPGGSFGPPCVENQRLFQPPLTNFVPAAKVWCDWLLYQSSVWNPPPVSHDVSGVDTWGVIGELATIVKGIGPPDVNLTEDAMSAYSTPVILPEDSFLRGYVHIVSGQAGAYYASRSVNKERAQDWIRVKKLQVCLSQFLCGVEPPVLRLQKTDQGEILVAVVAVSPPDSPAVARSSVGSSEIDFEDSNSDVERSDSDDEGDFGSPVDVGGEDTPLASTVRLLARRKKLLEKRQKQQRKMQAILDGAVTLEMEVKPRYLVPDTNCFIEKLNIIKALIEGTSYTFMVPLIVLVELDGLSKDAAVEKYGDVAHAVTVREGAATALHYVQSNKNPRLKCVTSQGSVAPANMFSLEMDTLKDITNDDKILSCCLHLCSDANKRRPIKEGVRRLHREVVLLTEDRNLRVKAYARDVPVRELTDFAHWAGVK